MKRLLATVLSLVLILTGVLVLPGRFNTVQAAKPKLSEKKISLRVDETKKLTVKGAKKVTWSTSNKKVATVNSKGVVTAVAKGSAKITATVAKTKLTCKVTVKPAVLALSKTQIDLVLSKPEFAVAATYNDKSLATSKIKWATSDESVATVDAGKIIAKSAGSATITASYKKTKATIKLTVTDDTQPKELSGSGLEISSDVFSVTEDDDTIPVRVTFDGKDITGEVSWSTSNVDIIEFEDGEFIIGEAGKATITGTYNGQTVNATVVVSPGTDDGDDGDYDDGDDWDDGDDGDDGDYDEEDDFDEE